MNLHLSTLVFLLAFGVASGTSPSAAFVKNCVQLEVPIHVKATNFVYQTLRVDSNIDAVEWTLDLDTWSSPNATARILGKLPIDDDFVISAQLCVAGAGGDKADILQIASHGVGFDKSIWDLGFKPEQYSYVDAALQAGYSILTYDRLGSGLSSKPDAYDVLQTPLQSEVIKELTILVKSGELLTVSNKTSGNKALTYQPSTIVHVGHSYGSIATNLFLTTYPNMSDAALLTGFLISPKAANLKLEAGDFAYAAQLDPVRFADRGSGYMAFGTLSSFQLDSLRKATFELDVLLYYNETKQTVAVGELLSLTVGVGVPVKGFRGPVQLFVGEFDFPFCAGDCNGAFELDDIKAVFPDALDVSVHLQPGTGHVVTMSTNATSGYAEMFAYLNSFGF